MKGLQLKTKQRLSAFPPRHGKIYGGRCNWTKAHLRRPEEVKLNQHIQQVVFQEYLGPVNATGKRVDGLDQQVAAAARESVFWPMIEALTALRGVSLRGATLVVAEIGLLHRFASAPQLLAHLALIPSKHSNGATNSSDGITKTGNGHVRRVLIEAT